MLTADLCYNRKNSLARISSSPNNRNRQFMISFLSTYDMIDP